MDYFDIFFFVLVGCVRLIVYKVWYGLNNGKDNICFFNNEN